MKYKHSHPINIIEYTSKFLVLLVFPVLRALLFTKFDLYTWLKGAWFDIFVILLIIALGCIAWRRFVYCLDSNGIYIKKGIWLVKKRFLPYSKISVTAVEYPFYFVPIKAVRLIIDTDGGLPIKPDLKITVKKKEIDSIINFITTPLKKQHELKRAYQPKHIYITILSFVVSNTLTGVLFVSTFISGLGKVLGKEFESQIFEHINTVAKFLAFGLPPVAAMIGFVILGGWGVAFIINIVRHLRFKVIRQGNGLEISSGLVTKRQYFLAVGRINLIEIRQSLFTKIFKIYTAFIHSNGYGKKKDELSVIMPAGKEIDIAQNFNLILPEIPLFKPSIKPRRRFITRFLFRPILLFLAVFFSWIFFLGLFPRLTSVILFVGIMAQIPCVWYIIVKILSFSHTGIGFANGVYTFSYTIGFQFKTVSVPHQKIVKVKIRQNIFQARTNSCTAIVYTFSEGSKKHIIPQLDYLKIKELLY